MPIRNKLERIGIDKLVLSGIKIESDKKNYLLKIMDGLRKNLRSKKKL